MNTINNRIQFLDNISQAKIKSAVHILSLNDVVLELVKNALDAQAEDIRVVLNYAHGFCSVTDNGHGIPPDEFDEDGGLAKPFHTSRLGREERTYGHCGRYLATLAGLSLLSVTSRTYNGRTHTLWLDESGRLQHTRETSDALEVETGTRVKVYSLFSKLPVRSRSLADRFAITSEVQKEFDKLKHSTLSLIVAAHRAFSIILQHSSPKHVYKHKAYCDPKSLSTIPPFSNSQCLDSAVRHAGYIESSRFNHWQELFVQSGDIRIRGLISKIPMPYKAVQFVSLNHFPVTKSAQPVLFQTINALFEKSPFGNCKSSDDENSDSSQDRRQPRGYAKAVDRWPMFSIWISTASNCIQDLVHNDAPEISAQKLLTRITSLVQTLIEEFLVTYGFVLQRDSNPPPPRGTTPSVEEINSKRMSTRQDQSKDSFRYWSRVKSARPSVLDNVLTGLPFHDKIKNGSFNASLLPATVPSLRDSHSTEPGPDTSSVTNDFDLSVISAAAQQDCILWTNPQTGIPLRLDPRTGMVLHKAPTSLATNTSNDSSQHAPRRLGQSRSLDILRSRCKNQEDLSLVRVAQNVRLYSKNLASFRDEPIRSIAPSAYDSEGLEERTHSRAERSKSFWTSIDNHGYRPWQLERPAISKKALRSAQVLRQVDHKFLLSLMQDEQPVHNLHGGKTNAQIVLIDQHAADERCKVEALFRSLHQDEVVTLSSPIIFEVPRQEATLFDAAKSHFAQWNILYGITPRPAMDERNSDHQSLQIAVTGLPPVIAERCRLHPKLLIEMLRGELWSEEKRSNTVHRADREESSANTHPRLDHSPKNHKLSFGAHIPPRLLEMINSRACRSAIMFNDELNREQCETLLKQLSTCILPFQCAHGRPSMVVLVNINDLPYHNPLTPLRKPISATLAVPSRDQKLNQASIVASNKDISNGPYSGHRPADTARTRLNIGLNTIEGNNTSFGQAYRAWLGPNRTQ